MVSTLYTQCYPKDLLRYVTDLAIILDQINATTSQIGSLQTHRTIVLRPLLVLGTSCYNYSRQ